MLWKPEDCGFLLAKELYRILEEPFNFISCPDDCFDPWTFGFPDWFTGNRNFRGVGYAKGVLNKKIPLTCMLMAGFSHCRHGEQGPPLM